MHANFKAAVPCWYFRCKNITSNLKFNIPLKHFKCKFSVSFLGGSSAFMHYTDWSACTTFTTMDSFGGRKCSLEGCWEKGQGCRSLWSPWRWTSCSLNPSLIKTRQGTKPRMIMWSCISPFIWWKPNYMLLNHPSWMNVKVNSAEGHAIFVRMHYGCRLFKCAQTGGCYCLFE